ncbi:MAG: class I SAM-dependent methyltransferase, partial [Actinomycetota bacterium]|nr:class I SAM-dependent methyltransferase [Actinomycetota bacterium]
WAPNVAVARERLAPLGITVVPYEAAPDNVDQRDDDRRARLPFATESFELVVSRHEAFVAREVHRVLVPGGRFLTQQLGGSRYDGLRRDLGLPPSERTEWTLELAVAQLERASLRVVESGGTEVVTLFADVGALAWFLRAAPWVVPELSLDEHREALAELHRRIAVEGPYEVRERSFWIEAVRDPASRAGG